MKRKADSAVQSLTSLFSKEGKLPRYAQVDVSVDNRGSVTVVVASGEDAVWVEFGAGVYHNGSPGSSPHPHGAELGMTIGGFGKGNGKKEVWGFYENGELKLSHGTPARMPMALQSPPFAMIFSLSQRRCSGD